MVVRLILYYYKYEKADQRCWKMLEFHYSLVLMGCNSTASNMRQKLSYYFTKANEYEWLFHHLFSSLDCIILGPNIFSSNIGKMIGLNSRVEANPIQLLDLNTDFSSID